MYFKSRAEAGRMLAAKLTSYSNKNSVVVALTPGAVIVGAQIAMEIHSTLMMLLTENITLPGEIDPLAAVSSENTFTYNNKFSTGEIEELHDEFLGLIESQRLEHLHHLHALLGHGGEMHRELLKHKVVILVSDGLSSGFSLDVAADYLKSVRVKKLIVVTPVASVSAVDKMHLVGDELICLSVAENYIETNHYYDNNTIPDTEGIVKILMTTPVNWAQHTDPPKQTPPASAKP
jgi:putative phosphoribosyl transferase